MTRPTKYTPEHRFIDALRECLGLSPLSGETELADNERFVVQSYPVDMFTEHTMDGMTRVRGGGWRT